MKLSMIAMVVAMGCAVSISSAHADVQSEMSAAGNEFAIVGTDSSMSFPEVVQKAERYADRADAQNYSDAITSGNYMVIKDYNGVSGWSLVDNSKGTTTPLAHIQNAPEKVSEIEYQDAQAIVTAKASPNIQIKAQAPKVDGIAQSDYDRITAEMIKADQKLKNPDVSSLGASKLITTPNKAAHVASPVVVTDIHNDSSAKREQQTAITLAKSAPVVNASSYRMAIAQEEQKTTGAEPIQPTHSTATAHTVQQQQTLTAATPKAAKAAVTNSATTSAPSTVEAAQSYFVADAETIQAVNDLVDAHNENVTAIDDHEQRIGALESHDKQQDKTIEHNNKKAMAGIAGALAQTGLHYTATANSVAIGGGNYAGESAVAVGYSHMWDGVRVSVQNSVDSMHNVGTSASLAVGW